MITSYRSPYICLPDLFSFGSLVASEVTLWDFKRSSIVFLPGLQPKTKHLFPPEENVFLMVFFIVLVSLFCLFSSLGLLRVKRRTGSSRSVWTMLNRSCSKPSRGPRRCPRSRLSSPRGWRHSTRCVCCQVQICLSLCGHVLLTHFKWRTGPNCVKMYFKLALLFRLRSVTATLRSDWDSWRHNWKRRIRSYRGWLILSFYICSACQAQI